jgi:hypothetical protein
MLRRLESFKRLLKKDDTCSLSKEAEDCVLPYANAVSFQSHGSEQHECDVTDETLWYSEGKDYAAVCPQPCT